MTAVSRLSYNTMTAASIGDGTKEPEWMRGRRRAVQMTNPDDQGRIIETATEVGIATADRDAPRFFQGQSLLSMAATFADAALKMFPVDDQTAFLALYRTNFITAYQMRCSAKLEELAQGGSNTIIRPRVE